MLLRCIVERENEEIRLNHPVEFMRLTLTYEGPLHAASGGETRNAEKHTIRQRFHRELRDAWQTHLALRDSLGRQMSRIQSRVREMEAGRRMPTVPKSVAFPIIQRVDFNFVPLVCRDLYGICELDILFLRREPAGGIVNQAGDIDNRIKVLFDALRVPQNDNEIPSTITPDFGEDPFYCLLEDDKLITSFRLESDQLFGEREQSDAWVKLVIRATVKVQRLIPENVGLGDTI
jgi:hypothetical protein